MKENKLLSVKTIVAIGIGSAVFWVLGRFVAIPSGVPNTEIQTAYGFLALMAILYGPIAGIAIGFIGHTIKDITMYGAGWYSWIIASAVLGLIIGLAWKKIRISEGVFGKREIVIFNIYQVFANIVAWGIVAPTLDIAIYAEPMNKVYLQGIVAGLSNIVTIGIIGTLLLTAYAKTRVKKGSLDKEESRSV